MDDSAESAARLTFIGTATTLLRLGNFTLLTDPNFLHRGERAYLGYGLSSKRLTEPALSPAELPALDAVVLSHLHGDHWDRRARTGLDSDLPVLTTPSAAARLRRKDGFPAAVGLETWGQHSLVKGDSRLTVTAAPAAHSRNRLLTRLLPPVMGSILEFNDGGGLSYRVYVTGDTMPIDELAKIPRRYPALDAIVIHLGGTTLPGGLVVTMTGPMGADFLSRVPARVAVPVHYDDYGVFKSGLDDFRRAAEAAELKTEIRLVGRGETISLM